MNLYYLTAFHWKANEWWRFAISAQSGDEAVAKFKDGYDDKFSRIGVKFICTTADDVFMEI
jgi:hypothetical protein